SAGVDYIDTLRAYLDNGCNASQTAKAMYLHRSTLVQRLDRIREIVDLELPERRLYLSMCLHLPGIDWSSLPNDDIEDFG
ncbi:MAG: helix-turn-helix domain-containing protein, partial [Atopobiaceae bacterium]|nr:helix-turn-helix domain-containing protein [Atopobiaceae bacterium]